MKNFNKFICEVKRNSDYNKFPEAFKERIELVYLYLTSKVVVEDRSVAAPYSLTDLGVRKNRSSEHYTSAICKKYNIQNLTDSEICQDLQGLGLEDFGILLDYYILIFGRYEPILEAIKARGDSIDSYDTMSLMSIATIYGAMDMSESIVYFDKIVESNCDSLTKVIAMQRAAVVEIKRSKNFSNAKKRIREIIRYKFENSTDELVVLALLDNLYPLIMMNDNNENLVNCLEAELMLKNACALCDVILRGEYSKKVKSQAARYRSQIVINYGQLLVFNKEYDEASKILYENLKFVEVEASEYSSEAYSTYAYSLFLSQNYEGAIENANKAIDHYRKIGNVVGIKVGREIMIGAYSKLGNKEMCEKYIDDMENDILGDNI